MKKRYFFFSSAVEDWMPLTTANTTTTNIQIRTISGAQYQVDWGDGTITTHNSDTVANKTYSTPYAGIIKVRAVSGGLININKVQITAGNWNFDISTLKYYVPNLTTLHLQSNTSTWTGNLIDLPRGMTGGVRFQGNLMSVNGSLSDLPIGLSEFIYFQGDNIYLTGNGYDIPQNLTEYIYFYGSNITVNINLLDLPRNLTGFIHFQGNSMTVNGNTEDIPSGLTRFIYLSGSNIYLNGDLSDLPQGLQESLRLEGANVSVTGDVSDIPSGIMGTLYLGSNNIQLSGNLSDLPTGLTNQIYLSGNMISVTGNIENVPNVASFTVLSDLSTLTGDISLSTNNATVFRIQSTSSVCTYSYTKNWKNVTNMIIRLSTGHLTSTEVDNIFIDLDNSPLVTGSGTIDLRGNNAPPTSASLSARNSLVSKGKTLLYN